MNIPKNEQIAAILENKVDELAQQYQFDDPEELSWEISKKELVKYVNQNGFPDGSVFVSEKHSDGVYFIKIGFHWTVFYKERGVICKSEKFLLKKNALVYLLQEYYLPVMGLTYKMVS